MYSARQGQECIPRFFVQPSQIGIQKQGVVDVLRKESAETCNVGADPRYVPKGETRDEGRIQVLLARERQREWTLGMFPAE